MKSELEENLKNNIRSIELDAVRREKRALDLEVAKMQEHVVSLENGKIRLVEAVQALEEKVAEKSESHDRRKSVRMADETKGHHDDSLVQTLISKEVQIHSLTSQLETVTRLNASQAKELDQLTARLASMEAQSEVSVENIFRSFAHFSIGFFLRIIFVCLSFSFLLVLRHRVAEQSWALEQEKHSAAEHLNDELGRLSAMHREQSDRAEKRRDQMICEMRLDHAQVT